MKKIFTLSILLLLSLVTTTSFASGKTKDAVKQKSAAVDGLIPPEFSSDDDSNEIWYYIRFGRRANENLVWTTDHPTNENSWAIKQLAQKTSDKTTQHWKLVGDLESFYIVNRATGFKVMYAEAADAEKGIRGDNYIVDATGGPGTNLRLAGSRDNRVATYWDWSGALDWVMINPAISDHAFMNDRGSNTDFPWRDVCNYGWSDDGFRIQFVYAERQSIVVAVDSLVIETPIGHTGQGIFSGISNFNLTEGITATIEGEDAHYFGFFENNNTLPSGSGSLTITFAPTEIKTYNANLVLSGGTAEPVRVRLIGTGFNISEMPRISSEDNSDEHWYYIQFYRNAAANTVWSQKTDTTRMIVQDTLKGGVVRDDQQWKICGDWEGGFYFVNKTGIEMAYNLSNFEDGSAYANRYISVGGTGDLFDFIRFKVSGVATSDWQLYNRSTTASSKYVNDQGGKHLTNYSANDAGCRLIFIPADRPVIKASVTSVSIDAPANESITSTITITGLQTAAINVAVSGADAAAFSVSPTSLPAEGGALTVTFSPTEVRNYTATLTLTSEGADDLAIPLTGNSDLGLPAISTSGNDVWYYIQFTRNAAQVWSAVPGTEGRYDTQVMQVNQETENQDQHWKFEGNWTDGYRIINRNGGAFFFDDVTTLRILLTEETAFGDLFKFERQNSTAKWQLKVIGKYDEEEAYAYLNDFGGSNRDGSIGLYLVNDGGNTVNFLAADGTGIQVPDFDPNDKVVAVKYYTLQGVEVLRPTTTGVYILRNLYASGKVKATKQLFIVK